MKKEAKKLVTKAAKVAGVVCVTAGAVALMTSKTALQAMLKGGEYLKDSVKKIMDEEPESEVAAEEAAEAEKIQEDAPAAEENA